MSNGLYDYYDRELRFLREEAKEFARKHPDAAGRLRLEDGQSLDPFVERMLEGFALLAGRVRHKLDDEFPELTDALLGVLYPHYLAPIPSMSIVQFELDPGRAQLPNGFLINRDSALHTPPIQYDPDNLDKRLPCFYRTGYPVTLWPISLTGARLQPPPFPPDFKPPANTVAALRLQFECQAELQFTDLTIERLRLYLHGDKQLIANLYEAIFKDTIQVWFRSLERDGQTQQTLLTPADCLEPVGFGRDEGLLRYPNQSFVGYRLLTEFFTFPNKFLFVDLGGWRQARQAGIRKKLEVVFFLSRSDKALESNVNAEKFQLGCTPVVNLFEKTAEGIRLTHTRYEYPVIPDVAHTDGMEVYHVESVSSSDPTAGTSTEYQPFYSFRHERGDAQNQPAFWHATRRPSPRPDDRGTEVFLNLVDLNFRPYSPAEMVVVVRTMCTNRDLANKFQRQGDKLVLQQMAPINQALLLATPTPALRPPMGRRGYWRLISHLNLNHLSLADSLEGVEALREILRLYDFSDRESGQQLAEVNRQLIDGVLSVSGKRVVDRTGGPISSGFCRGLEVTVEFDEEKYLTTGLYLFASVLERFLGLYASINSFTKLVAKTKKGGGILKTWPPRAGEHRVL